MPHRLVAPFAFRDRREGPYPPEAADPPSFARKERTKLCFTCPMSDMCAIKRGWSPVRQVVHPLGFGVVVP